MLQISPLVIDDRKNSHHKIKYTFKNPSKCQSEEMSRGLSVCVMKAISRVGANHRPVLRSRDQPGPIRAQSQPEPELVLGAECTFGNVLICPCHLGKLLLWVWWLNFSKLVQPKVGISLRWHYRQIDKSYKIKMNVCPLLSCVPVKRNMKGLQKAKRVSF